MTTHALGDTVTIRRSPYHHPETARVVATYTLHWRDRVDVETENGERLRAVKVEARGT